uniref:Uncharacterized protein n=1 Tax=Cannabis sativa TaxID=3483 RepID=A0A803QRY0_CANSA
SGPLSWFGTGFSAGVGSGLCRVFPSHGSNQDPESLSHLVPFWCQVTCLVLGVRVHAS